MKENASKTQDHASKAVVNSLGKGSISFPARVQSKLTIAAVNDPLQQEADAMADRVMRRDEPLAQQRTLFNPSTTYINLNTAGTQQQYELRRKENEEEFMEQPLFNFQYRYAFDASPLPPSVDANTNNSNSFLQRKCAACEAEEKQLQREQTNTGETVAGTQTEDYISSLNGRGHALTHEQRSFFEPRFGYDFSDVQLHTNTEANESAKNVSALAYTHGNNIVFGANQYQPDTDAGKKLMAHELTHVVQQQSGIKRSIIQRSPGSNAGGCGLCYGTPRDVGTEAHRIIETAFLDRYPWLQTEFPVLGSPTDDNGKLDLADLDGGSEHINIGEIKPANAAGLIQGDLDLHWYEDQLQMLGMSVDRMILPPPIGDLTFPTLAPAECPQTQELFIEPPVHGTYTYYCEPDYSSLVRECDCNSGRRVRVPVPVPRSVIEKIKDFVKRVIETGEDVDQAAQEFLQANPDLKDAILAASITAIVGLVIAMLAEDIATLGAAIVNNPLVIAAITALFRVAQLASD